MFQGTLTAMVTPFQGEAIDEKQLRANVEFQVTHGVSGLVPVGTTGESPTLGHDENNQVVSLVVDAAAGRVPVIAGTGSNSTREAIQMTQHAKDVGASASLQVCPYYNKPTQEGFYRHFMTIADRVDLPIMLYNIPGRCGAGLTIQTIERLAKHPNIQAIKEATGGLDMASDIAAVGDLAVLSGDDSLTLPMMSIGGQGVVSVLSNILPDQISALTTHGLAGEFEQARALHQKLLPLFKIMFIETNPVPIKTAMAWMGMTEKTFRLPLCEMAEENAQLLYQQLESYGLSLQDR